MYTCNGYLRDGITHTLWICICDMSNNWGDLFENLNQSINWLNALRRYEDINASTLIIYTTWF